MKKFSLLLMSAVLFAVCLTSCIGDSGNTQSGYAVGIVDFSSTMQMVLKSSVGNLYAPEISKLEPGGCYYVYYTIDYDADANSTASVQAKNYYTVAINSSVEAGKYYTNSYLTDTATILPNEIPVLDGLVGGQAFGYASGYLFLAHAVKIPSDLQVSWDMSYDEATMAPTVENGSRYYDLFLRATKKNTSDKTALNDVSCINAYNMESYIKRAAQKEKDAGNSKFTIRINYASAIDTAANKITWSNKMLSDILVSNFVDTAK